jgi:hypothetical protein
LKSVARSSKQPYHCHENLVFQFIFAEFLIIHPIIAELQQQIIHKKFAKERYIKTLEYLVGEDIGSSRRCFSWSLTEGRLAKLNSHCLQLMRIIKENERSLSMHRNIDQALIYCMQALTGLQMEEDLLSKESFCLLVKKMSDRMHQFSNDLFSFLKYFGEDENTLFFVLHSAGKLDSFYHSGFTASLLTDISRKSLDELESFLVKAYRKRGFSHLLPTLRTLFYQLPTSERVLV